MSVIVTIEDDFDLKKIVDSGQCFRPKEIEPGLFRFITLDHVIYMKKVDEDQFEISCGQTEWDLIWKRYFDINTNYAEIRQSVAQYAEKKPFKDYLNTAIEFSKGIRILQQDPFEMLISFIISQRKNIPAIRKSVEMICDSFGKVIPTHIEEIEVHAFPQIDELCKVSAYELSRMSLGYRSAYIRDALIRVKGLTLALDDLYNSSDDDVIDSLKTVHGVGDKIAACIALYSYHRFACVPIDVWIKRAIVEDFNGENVFVEFGALAGVLQQYIFYYKRMNKKVAHLDEY